VKVSMDFRAILKTGLDEKKLEDGWARESGSTKQSNPKSNTSATYNKAFKSQNKNNFGDNDDVTFNNNSSFDNANNDDNNDENNENNTNSSFINSSNISHDNNKNSNINSNKNNNIIKKKNNNKNQNNWGVGIPTELILELMQNDQKQLQAAEEQARKMTEDALATRKAEAEEKSKQKQLQKEAFEREKESRTQILRKRIPGQTEQPKVLFTIPPPDTPEQIKEKKKELKELRAQEAEQQRVQNELKGKKLEEKKAKKLQNKINKENSEKQNPSAKKSNAPVPEPQHIAPKQEAPVVSKPPKPKTPDEIAAEKRAKVLEEQAEVLRQKKKQVQLTKLAYEMTKAEARKTAQAERADAGQSNKALKEKKNSFEPKGKKKGAPAKEQSSNMMLIVTGSFVLFALLAYFLLYGQS